MLARLAVLGLPPQCVTVQSVPSTLRVTYDGQRRGRDYVLIDPGTLWGEKAYGLKPTDDFTFQPRSPSKGDRLSVVLSDEAYRLLVLQRERRRQMASSRTKKIRAPSWRR